VLRVLLSRHLVRPRCTVFYGSVDRLPVRTPGQSSETRCRTPSPDSAWPVAPFSGVAWIRLVSPESLPEVPPAKRDARLLLPSRGSLGHWFPTFPTRRHRAPSPRYYAPLRLPKARLGVVRCSLSSPDTLHRSSFFVSLFAKKARVRGESLLSTPGVFTVPVGTPTPDVTQGDLWLSHVPASPLCLHAPLVGEQYGAHHRRQRVSDMHLFSVCSGCLIPP
jgi:hypothetical protein